MGSLDGRVAIITGGGRGLGREHALLFASEGAKVVINDLGGATDGSGADVSVAQQVVDEIKSLGGEAVANSDSVTDWEGAQRLVATAVESFGALHVVVNNAGILRDRMLVNMAEAEWDAVIAVHLKGTFCVTRHAAAYWRERSKAGDELRPAIVNTSSGAGLFNNVGQTNYGAAKAAIAAFSMICAKELKGYGVRVNVIAPIARTRLTLQTPGLDQVMAAPEQGFDTFDPGNISPLVAYLATENCPFSGGVFHVAGGEVGLLAGWSMQERVRKDGRWTVAELETAAKKLLDVSPEKNGFMASEVIALEQLLGG